MSQLARTVYAQWQARAMRYEAALTTILNGARDQSGKPAELRWVAWQAESALRENKLTEAVTDAEAEYIGQTIVALLRRAESNSGAWDIVQGEISEGGWQLESTEDDLARGL